MSRETTIAAVRVTSTAPYGRMPAMFTTAITIMKTNTQVSGDGPPVHR